MNDNDRSLDDLSAEELRRLMTLLAKAGEPARTEAAQPEKTGMTENTKMGILTIGVLVLIGTVCAVIFAATHHSPTATPGGSYNPAPPPSVVYGCAGQTTTHKQLLQCEQNSGW